jgi:hypothetical protein
MTSTYSSAATGTAPSRPGALLAGLAASAGAGLLTIVSQGLVLAGGEETARAAVEDELGAELGSQVAELPALFDAAVAEAQDTLETRAFLGIGVAVVVLVLTAVAMRGGRVARGFLVAFLALGALLMLRSVTDVFPSTATAVGWVAILLAPVAAVLLFLPGVGRYRAARRGA